MTQVGFGSDMVRPAVLTIDLHRGHLDPAVATLPLAAHAAAAVTETNVAFLKQARAQGLPIVHMVTTYRDTAEIHMNRFWRAIDATSATRANMREHNFEGRPGTQLMPGVFAAGDYVVDTKKRYDCFLATDLEFLLTRLGVNTLLISGVNTNSCVLATTIAASTRDYAAIVLSDCVDTMDGEDYHNMALAIIERAFGWVLPWHEALHAVGEATRETVSELSMI